VTSQELLKEIENGRRVSQGNAAREMRQKEDEEFREV
jgi:hypothetical protein